ncbi:unnamed protein product [Alopecurus aequalis]
MANAWRIAVMTLSITVAGWFLTPIIALLVNKTLPRLGFDASRKLRDLEIHLIPKMKQVLRDIEEQRMQRKARKERSAVATLETLAKDVKAALYQGEDILDLIDYHQIEKNIIGDVECKSNGSSWLQRLSEVVWGHCKRSWLGRCVWITQAAVQRWARSLSPLVQFLQEALHRSAALLPVSRAPSVSFVHRLRCWCQSILVIWAGNLIEVASSYRNWSYDMVVGITSYQEDGITEDSFMPAIDRWNLRKKIEELENIVTDAQKSDLLNKQSSGGRNDIANMNRRSITSSATRKVFGRDNDRDMIKIMLREGPDDDAQNTTSSKCYSVICIYGIAGSGKTTLAKYVCDHEKEDKDKYFDQIMLIHLSETFILDDILHDMLEEITQDRHSNVNGCRALQAKLVEKMRGIRFLLVLDDLWVKDENRQDLEELLSPLNVGKRGSKILVTARNKESALGANALISISDLDEEQYFSMFMHYALDGTIFDDRRYIPIGRKIAKKLHRSPIAAVTVAGQLWRNPDISFWETAAKLDMLNKTKGALWWSYQQLDVDVRRCFEYCNIFPRRYELERDKLVHMWIAQGFVKTVDAREKEDVEDVGQDYFHDLHSCAFLQLKRKSSSDINSGEYFTIHDLLHDLAEVVAGIDCVRISRAIVGRIPKYVRHLCIESYGDIAFPEQIFELPNLSTLIMCYSTKGISQDDFKRVFICLRKLRVVQLDVQWLYDFPACIGQLKHLRYLGVSLGRSNSMTLPAEFAKLYHLQELSVPPNTRLLCSSEDKMANLVSLRRMLTWYGLNFPNIGRLTSLQFLHHFYVRDEEGYEIQQLEHLNNLHGKLFIECLDKVESKEDALQARLSDKVHLTELTLWWGGIDEISKSQAEIREVFFGMTNWTNRHKQSGYQERQAGVLEGLQPPPQITTLCIRGYGGQRYPSWLSGEGTRGSNNSTHVPDLQFLMFWDCYGSPTPPKIGKFYIHLSTLTVSGCSWTSLPQNLDRMTSLKELNIQECPNIESLPTLPPSLTTFILSDCNRSLTSSCRTKGHANWLKIRHIPVKRVK